MLYNRAFAQPAFWDFVHSLQNRDTEGRQVSEPTDGPPSWGAARRRHGGFGRRNRNGTNMNAAAEAEATPSIFAGDEKERGMPPAYPMQPQQTGIVPVTSENEKTPVTETTPLMNDGGKNCGGPGGFRKLRMRLQEKGLSEDEIATRIEKRRARRTALGNGEDPRARRMRNHVAEADPLNTEGEATTDGDNRGPGRRGHGLKRRNGGKRLRSGDRDVGNVPSANEEIFNAEKPVEKPAPAAEEPRAPNANANAGLGTGFVPRNHLKDITKGGPAKFAGRFNKQDVNLSDDNVEQAEQSQDECKGCGRRGRKNVDGPPKRRGMRSGMRNLQVNDAEGDQETAMAPAMRKRKMNGMNKMNKRNGANKMHGKSDKSFAPRADVFETKGAYIVHVPVPGAKQEDVGVTWEPENSALYIAGVVHRPSLQSMGKDCTMLRGQRVVGPFERKIKLAKKSEKVKIYEDGVTALLEDGILTIQVPKYDGADHEDMAGDEGFVQVNEKV